MPRSSISSRALWLAAVLLGAAAPAHGDELVSVRIATDPPGARIFIDGLERGETPASLSLPAGKHDVFLYKPGLLPVRKQVEWAPGERPIFNEKLREQRGGLVVIVDPPGSEVFFDGRLLGQSPLASENLPAGSHVIELRKPGFTTERETVDIGPTPRELAIRLDGPPVGLFIEAKPGSRVFLDGAFAGEVTGETLSLRARAGTHELRIEHNGFASVRQILLEPGRDALLGPGPMTRIPTALTGERQTARLNPRWYWVGASGAVALAGTVLAVRSALAAGRARDDYEGAFRRAAIADAKDRIILHNRLVGVGLGVAALGAAGVVFAWPRGDANGVTLEVEPGRARLAWRFP